MTVERKSTTYGETEVVKAYSLYILSIFNIKQIATSSIKIQQVLNTLGLDTELYM